MLSWSLLLLHEQECIGSPPSHWLLPQGVWSIHGYFLHNFLAAVSLYFHMQCSDLKARREG